MISIVTVNFNSNDFITLLLNSIERTRSEKIEIVLVDNSHCESHFPCSYLYNSSPDKTHGHGLNLGLKIAQGEEVLILDSDCHFLQPGWEQVFRTCLENHDCLTVAGPPQKPLRPACCFMKHADAILYDWRATAGYQGHRITPEGFDVGIVAYHQMKAKNCSFYFMEIGSNRYGTRTGEEYGIDGKMYIYHHWHGSHLADRQYDYDIDLQHEKNLLFQKIPWLQKTKLL